VTRVLRWAWLLLLPAIPYLQRAVDQRLGTFTAQEEALYVWSGDRIRRMAPGFEDLMADVYWLRTVQYFGAERAFATNKRFELLSPLISITTTLDPRLEIAYRYGAIFMAEPWPVGAGQPDQAIALLRRGAQNNPSAWRLQWSLGYFRFTFKHDAHGAADTLLKAAEIPGAPFWLRTMAGSFLAKGGDRQTSRLVWQQILAQSEPGAMRDNAAHHLLNLDARDAEEIVQKAVDGYRARTGRLPASLAELPGSGGQPARDPAGTPFRYDPEKGVVDIDPKSRAWSPN
jgi:hypothetical protein